MGESRTEAQTGVDQEIGVSKIRRELDYIVGEVVVAVIPPLRLPYNIGVMKPPIHRSFAAPPVRYTGG